MSRRWGRIMPYPEWHAWTPDHFESSDPVIRFFCCKDVITLLVRMTGTLYLSELIILLT